MVQRGARFSIKTYFTRLSIRAKDFQTRFKPDLVTINKQCSSEPSRPSSPAKLMFQAFQLSLGVNVIYVKLENA